MKKLLILLLPLLLVGCSKANDNTISKSNLKGYWAQIERDWSGEIDYMEEDPYAYMEITDSRIYFYTESSTDKGYYETIAAKYYVLKDNQIYYDYYEIKNYEDVADSPYGGIFEVSFVDKKLVLTEYNGETIEDGYSKDTYIKVKDEDRLLEY